MGQGAALHPQEAVRRSGPGEVTSRSLGFLICDAEWHACSAGDTGTCSHACHVPGCTSSVPSGLLQSRDYSPLFAKEKTGAQRCEVTLVW